MQLTPQPHLMVLLILGRDLPGLSFLGTGLLRTIWSQPPALAYDHVPLSLDGSLDSLSGSLGHWGVAYVAGRVFGVSLPGLQIQTETPSTTCGPSHVAIGHSPLKPSLTPGSACCQVMPGWERSFAAGSGVGISIPVGAHTRHGADGETWLGAEELSSTS